ncbi:class I SAM-dependent methyltransferase [Xenorhabdus szentirmaii]|uniref:class I SAM-dependent methyltransferase n=2 Tax=Xenorhabdus szentirmaii TaxID=290112 RepID=UPI002B4015E7|nr:class I SAM-dependent methyltransferase [Xenorhabdus sp. ZM]
MAVVILAMHYLSGAIKVVGIDISEGMIAVAKKKSEQAGDNIEFHVRNVSEMESFGKFDIIVAVFLLPYSQSTEELEHMFQVAANHLNPSGKLVAYTVSPDYQLTLGNVENYGVRFLREEPWLNGFRYHAEFLSTPLTLFTCYRWSRESYETAIKKAGFNHYRWEKPIVADSEIERYPAVFWDSYLNNCAHIGLVCQF